MTLIVASPNYSTGQPFPATAYFQIGTILMLVKVCSDWSAQLSITLKQAPVARRIAWYKKAKNSQKCHPK